jgi:hypothetical protein
MFVHSRIGVSRMQVLRTVHEEDLYPYHHPTVQNLKPGDHAQRMDLCHWIQAHPELLGVILFTDEASFTRDGVNKCIIVYIHCINISDHKCKLLTYVLPSTLNRETAATLKTS